MLAAALAARGLRVGLYTSPHLVDFRERIKIIEQLPEEGERSEELPLRSIPPTQAWAPPVHMATGGHGSPDVPPLPAAGHKTGENVLGAGGVLPRYREIPENAVCEFMRLYDREGLTFFEVTTGMAFWWFAEEKVDVAVIETGLGGRLDSTNIITPEISVITSIGLDHCDLLGSTRAEIAAEKAGIFKPGVPALVWGRDPETQPVFECVATAAGSPLFFAEDFPLPEAARDLQLDLIGPCQDLNLRTVLAALAIMEERDSQLTDIQPHTQNRLSRRGQSISDKLLGTSDLRNTLCGGELEAIGATARITGFRGRWETLLTDPLTICDIGHNPPALAATFTGLAQLRRERPLLIIYGAMKDKDVDAIATLFPADAEYYLVQPETPRAMPLEELALKLKNLNPIAAGSVREGVEMALDRAKRLPGAIVYIGGSTFVVSEAITYIESL
jgi:dihydrofolate synthase/folylpolyglutamate synthase